MLLCVVSVYGYAGDPSSCTSTGNGNYSDAGTWSCVGGSVPGKSTDVTINHDVTLDENLTGGGGAIQGDWTIAIGASLNGGATYNVTFSNGTASILGTFEVNNLTIDNGAEVNFESTAAVTVNGDFTNTNNSNEVTVNTDNFDVTGDLDNGNGATMVGTGSIDVTGTVTNHANGTLLGGCVGADCCAGGCTLFIDLLSFGVNRNKKDVELKWTTASEVNNDYFIIEKSMDGFNFKVIGQVDGAGNSTVVNEYGFIDQGGNSNSTIYYRIVDVDFFGEKKYHQVAILKSVVAPGISSLIVENYTFGLGLNNLSDHATLVTIKSIDGKQIYLADVSGIKEFNCLLDLNAGVYLVTIFDQWGTLLQSAKVVRSW